MCLYKAGQKFREVSRLRNIPPHQYSALLEDLFGEMQEIMPALLDLSSRQLFKELPTEGSIGQKNLTKKQLLSELRPLYRDQIINDLEQFIEGVLGLSCNTTQDYHQVDTKQTCLAEESFYADNPSRLFFLTLFTGGFYAFLWTYRHWRHYKKLALKSQLSTVARQKDQYIIPLWCSIFAGFYIIGASRRIRLKLSEYKIGGRPIRPWLVFLLFSTSSILINIYEATESIGVNTLFLLVYILFECIMAAQPAILQSRANHILRHETTNIDFQPLNSWDVLFIGLGIILFTLIAIGIVIPPSYGEM